MIDTDHFIGPRKGFPSLRMGTLIHTIDGHSYKVLSFKGHGGWAMVVEAERTDTQERIAFKIGRLFKERLPCDHITHEQLLKERTILKRLGRCPYIMRLVLNAEADMIMPEVNVRLTLRGYELLSCSLREVIGTITLLELKNALRDVLRGVSHMHRKGYIHTDLKPENVMRSSQKEIWKLIDHSNALNKYKISTYEGRRISTRWYRAPELFCRSSSLFSEKIDMWSVGCILAEGLLKQVLFRGTKFIEIAPLMVRICGAFPEEMLSLSPRWAKAFFKGPEGWKLRQHEDYNPYWLRSNTRICAPDKELALAIRLIKRLLQIDPRDRPSAGEALLDPFFGDAPDLVGV